MGARDGTTPVSTSGAIEPDEDLVGTMVGNFRITRLLGRGGMGAVYLGEHIAIGSRVAVKFLHPALAADRGLVERFFAEARATNLIGHENIVSIFDLALLPPARYYLVMEYLEGQPLSAIMGAPVDPAVAVPILAQVCDALQAAHAAGVVHRDLKPENVFLVRREDCPRFVKLVDFGIAKLGQGVTAGMTAAGLAVGTPEFMAPEQWSGETVDGRADLYALGVMAYALATGRLPFFEKNAIAYWLAHRDRAPVPPSRFNPAIPPRLEQVILQALAKSPDARFENAQAMRAALLEALEKPSAPAPREPAPVEAPAAPPAAPAPLSPCEAPVQASAPPRHVATLPTRVRWGDEPERTLSSADLSRGGMFICSEPPMPPLFTRVDLVIQHGSGELACEAEVVRHVSPEQARAWGMSPGFAVQFARPSTNFGRTIDRLMAGRPLNETPSVQAAGDDPEVEKVLESFRLRIAGDHYGLLGVPADADCAEVRARIRRALAELDPLRDRPLTAGQRARLQASLERVQAAMNALGTPVRRAEYDARRGNFRGVARCLAAGLGTTQLEALRRAYLAERPRNETAAKLQLAAANAYVAGRSVTQALAALEAALALDPLSLELQQKYWALKRSLHGRT